MTTIEEVAELVRNMENAVNLEDLQVEQEDCNVENLENLPTPVASSWEVDGTIVKGVVMPAIKEGVLRKRNIPGNCPICSLAIENDKKHRACYLPCGHLFGMSCIKTFLQQSGPKTCPQCKNPCSVKDISPLFEDPCFTNEAYTTSFEFTKNGLELFRIHVEARRRHIDGLLLMARDQLLDVVKMHHYRTQLVREIDQAQESVKKLQQQMIKNKDQVGVNNLCKRATTLQNGVEARGWRLKSWREDALEIRINALEELDAGYEDYLKFFTSNILHVPH